MKTAKKDRRQRENSGEDGEIKKTQSKYRVEDTRKRRKEEKGGFDRDIR